MIFSHSEISLHKFQANANSEYPMLLLRQLSYLLSGQLYPPDIKSYRTGQFPSKNMVNSLLDQLFDRLQNII